MITKKYGGNHPTSTSNAQVVHMEDGKAGSSQAAEGSRLQPQTRHMDATPRSGTSTLALSSFLHHSQSLCTQSHIFGQSLGRWTRSRLVPVHIASRSPHVISNSPPRRIPRFSDPYHALLPHCWVDVSFAFLTANHPPRFPDPECPTFEK